MKEIELGKPIREKLHNMSLLFIKVGASTEVSLAILVRGTTSIIKRRPSKMSPQRGLVIKFLDKRFAVGNSGRLPKNPSMAYGHPFD